MRRLRRFWHWIRFGKITAHNIAYVADREVSEVEFHDRWGRVVGYWAYGYFDPNYPYRGE